MEEQVAVQGGDETATPIAGQVAVQGGEQLLGCKQQCEEVGQQGLLGGHAGSGARGVLTPGVTANVDQLGHPIMDQCWRGQPEHWLKVVVERLAG